MKRFIFILLLSISCIITLIAQTKDEMVSYIAYEATPLDFESPKSKTFKEDVKIQKTDTLLMNIKIYSNGRGYIILGDESSGINNATITLNVSSENRTGIIYFINYINDDKIFTIYEPGVIGSDFEIKEVTNLFIK